MEIPKSEVIEQTIDQIYQVAIFRTAIELRLWEKVAAGEDTAKKMAAQEGWDLTGTRALLDATCALKLLTKEGDRFYLVPESEYYLIPGKPTYKGDMIATEVSWEGNGGLAEAIRSGKRPIQYNATTPARVDLWNADYSRSWVYPHSIMEAANKLWQSVGIEARSGLRLLDVACGPAPKSLALARQHPGVCLTFLDWEGVLQSAFKAASKLGIEKQVSLLPGDLCAVEYGTGRYDVVYLGNITHFFSPDDNIRLFRRVYDALVSGGVLVVNSAGRRDRVSFPWWAEMWLYATSTSGAAYNFGEYHAMLKQAGYKDIEDINNQPIKAIKP